MRFNPELFIWCLALVGIAFIPLDAADHFTLCPLDNLGFHWCPGCGLGRSMKHFMVGEWKASWELHPLGGFGLLVIIMRIVEIIKNIKTIKNYG